MKETQDMLKSNNRVAGVAVMLALLTFAPVVFGQSGATRPRRVSPSQPTTTTPAPAPSPSSTTARSSSSTTTATPAPSTQVSGSAASAGDVTRAFALLRQNQFEAALKEARQIAARDPQNADAWNIAGFAQFNLKQYAEAAADLQRALDLQKASSAGEDTKTADALGQAYLRAGNFERALPLLVAATTRAGAKPDAVLLNYRGLAEYRTGKLADAERSFNAAIKLNPKDAVSLYYLGRMAFEHNDYDAAIASLNRATLADAQLADAWTVLTYSYMRRASAATGPKADADFLNAARVAESLLRLRNDEQTTLLLAQALIGAKQYVRAATALERIAGDNAQGSTLYMLGLSHSRAKNFPKAVVALERAAAKTPDDVNIYRELGYDYASMKQYAKALAAYEKGLQLAPDDADLKAAADAIRPFAK